MNDLIEKMKRSGNELLSAEARSAERLRKLKHNKDDLETLLTYSIAEIEFKPLNSNEFVRIICTSNKRFINVYKALKKQDKAKQIRSPFDGIKTRDSMSVDTYDLVEGKIKTISLRSWRAVNFIMLTEDNVLALDMIAKECLKK